MSRSGPGVRKAGLSSPLEMLRDMVPSSGILWPPRLERELGEVVGTQSAKGLASLHV